MKVQTAAFSQSFQSSGISYKSENIYLFPLIAVSKLGENRLSTQKRGNIFVGDWLMPFLGGIFHFSVQEALPAVQEEQKNLLQEMKTIQDAEHALQSEALSIKLKMEQIDSHISTHQAKVKYWQKEVGNGLVPKT